ncbi:DsbA family oxidoreductase [Dictyobacter aurantiacus]|uniref:Dithiol-disulfide isomerase n=1 Tax=Dictyobacter aurantiacus TaxID=1936993 RepID=A0A401ZM37_9CHLR|nr:DsbA family protein [Dictyobacter aurantiacus]GCE07923.1 dithiol-disulfide isomerase [Dictyobacter aurantiacus]
MAKPIPIAMYADLACPYAYVSAYRLRKLRTEDRAPVVIEHKSLALEYINKEPTPKPVLELEIELPVLVQEEPGIPYQPWQRPESEWPVTMWPAFEVVKCAERQSLELADALDWAIRTALFAESRCISMRHVLFDLSEHVGIEMGRFAEDFDRGVMKYQVLAEAQEGWERLHVAGSPTFVLPSGKQISNVGLPDIVLDPHQPGSVLVTPAPGPRADGLEIFRRIVAEAQPSSRQ